MKIYSFHPITKEFMATVVLGEGDRNPFKKDKFLLPANTVKEWPTVSAGENQAVIFNDSGWSLTPDFRGAECWYQTGEKVEISELGQTFPTDSINYDPVALAEEKTIEFEQAEAQAEAEAEAEAQAQAQAQAEEPTT